MSTKCNTNSRNNIFHQTSLKILGFYLLQSPSPCNSPIWHIHDLNHNTIRSIHITWYSLLTVVNTINLLKQYGKIEFHIPRPRSAYKLTSGAEIWTKNINMSKTQSRTYKHDDQQQLINKWWQVKPLTKVKNGRFNWRTAGGVNWSLSAGFNAGLN